MNKIKFLWLRIFTVFLCVLLTAQRVNAENVPVETSETKQFVGLMECYDLALKRSETLAISKEEIARAEATFFQATSQALGHVDFIATSFRQDAPAETSTDSSVGSTFSAREKTESRFAITQPLFQGFKSLGALTGAGNLRSQRKYEWIRAQHLLFLDVARSFYQVLRYEKDLEIIQEIKKLFLERIAELSERERIGRSRASELATANAGLKNIEAELAKSQGALTAEKNVLEFLIGMPLEGLKLKDTVIPGEEIVLSHYLSNLEMRPDVEASENAMKLARKNLIVVQSDLWPVVSLEYNRYTERDGFQSNIDWDALFKIDVPLFRGGKTIGNIKDAISYWKQAKFSYSRTKREAELDIKQTYQDWLTSHERYKALMESVRASEESFRLQKEEYTRNLVNNLDVLQALESLYQVNRQANEVYYESKLNHWRLQVASGQCCSEPL